jgi:hypothetical protein
MKTRYIPGGYSQYFEDQAMGAAVYVSPDSVYMIAYSGRRTKHDFYFSFKSIERMKEHFDKWLAALQRTATAKTNRRAERSATPNSFVIGDVLKAVWGYDQTNVDYYEVVGLAGKQTVVLREIAGSSVNDTDMTGYVVPCPGKYIGEPTRHRANGDEVKLASYKRAYKKEFTLAGGMKIFAPDRFTSYA